MPRLCMLLTPNRGLVNGSMVPWIVTEVPTGLQSTRDTVDGMAVAQNLPIDDGELINFDDATAAVVRPISSGDSAALSRFHSHPPRGPYSCAFSIHTGS